METKVCRKCLYEKPITEFAIADRERGYRKARCKACEAERVRSYYRTNETYRERTKKRSIAWAKDNKEASKRHARKAQLRLNYDLSTAQYERLLLDQRGCCALCGSDQPGRIGKNGRWSAGHWHVDHDHALGHVRGLLCHSCNVAIGIYERRLRDQIGIAKVLDYLKRPSPVVPEAVAAAPEYLKHEVAPPARPRPLCGIEGCGRSHYGNGLCQMHYARTKRGLEAGDAQCLPRGTARGAMHPKAKLTDDDVRAIRASDERGRRLAERYGVTATLITNIRKGKVWAHLN